MQEHPSLSLTFIYPLLLWFLYAKCSAYLDLYTWLFLFCQAFVIADSSFLQLFTCVSFLGSA